MTFKVGDRVYWLHEQATDNKPLVGTIVKEVKNKNDYDFYFLADGGSMKTPVYKRELTHATKLHKVLE